jgi:hypothetical protein
MSSMSFGVFTCFVGHLIFHQIKVSQMMNWSAPLRRARRDDRNRYTICYICYNKTVQFIRAQVQ